MTPTLAGFIAWVYSAMGIPTAILPSDSIWFVYAYNVANDIVDTTWACVSPTIYTLMIYNLGGSNLLNFAQDAADAPVYKDGQTYFAYMRTKYNILGPVTGVIASASDQGTASALEIPQAMKELTLRDLQAIKDPFGRWYVATAQEQGSLWGAS